MNDRQEWWLPVLVPKRIEQELVVRKEEIKRELLSRLKSAGLRADTEPMWLDIESDGLFVGGGWRCWAVAQ